MHPDSTPTRVFISYSREDEAFARQLHEAIEASGYDAWLDVKDIAKGEYWPDAIDAGLKASHVVVGVMTPDSVASRNVKNEWDWALSNDRPLLLLLLRPCDIPHRYVSINYIDFRVGESLGFAQLQAALADPHKPLHLDGQRPILGEAARARPLTERNRQRMLEKVRTFWIHGVLENSLHGAALLELGMEQRPEAVERPWDVMVQQANQPDRMLPAGTRIAAVYDDVGEELLILGAPGSGKTTMLLELARDLLARAELDEDHPIPVVFNLSAWADERQPIAGWLVSELSARYQVPRNIGSGWVKEDRVLPLLDGLDEVAHEHRPACLEAINQFREAHGLLPMVVCSRIGDYEALNARLRLQGAVLLQPLTAEQVDRYLESLGDELAAARTLLVSDTTLQEMAQTPLMLSIMTLAYRGLTDAAVLNQGAPEQRRRHLFDTYVERMLTRRGADSRYTPAQTRAWLGWLAQRMTQQAQTVFFIEGMQPDWVTDPGQRRLYIIGVRVVVGAIMGLTFGLAGGLLVAIPLGLAGIAVVGAGTGVGAGLMFTVFGVTIGVLGGLIGGLIVGVLAVVRERAQAALDRIEVIETLMWSWRKAAIGLAIGLGGGLVSAIIGSLAGGLNSSIGGQTAVVTAIAAAIGLGGGLLVGLTGREVGMRTSPNQGIRRSAQNALRVGLASMLSGGVVIGVAFGATTAVSVVDPELKLFTGLAFGLGLGVAFGIVFGLAGGTFFGGLACIQHVLLRVLLLRSGHTPRNYVHFLDFAAERIFLRKIGGGYIFIHRLLLEYFADSETG
jgi:hypothetical protein